MSERKWRIAWESRNGFEGHGEYCLTESTAAQFAKNCNEDHSMGQIHHWIEQEPEQALDQTKAPHK
jgi:hypothetical protein